ncbi:MAG: hypothetical protein GX561_07965 [Lentisphaerae bacterium]|nr:hypothetical protein [Lentisphaerota bacterium]
MENISSALNGIAASGEQKSIAGLALYCEWEMTPEKWKTWREKVRKDDENPQRQKESATVSGISEKKNGK